MTARPIAILDGFSTDRPRLTFLLAPLLLAFALPDTGVTQPVPATSPRVEASVNQQRLSVVRGSVRDSSNAPISFATVQWGDPPRTLRSSDSGSFEIAGLAAGRQHIGIRRLGFVPVEFDLDLKPGTIHPVVVNMVPVPEPLDRVSVERSNPMAPDSMRAERFRATGFFDRMVGHRGYFISPQEVDARRPQYISDLMYAVPGVRTIGNPHSASVRYVSALGQCRLRIFLDGHPAQEGDDFVPGSDIEAVEIYTRLSDVPGQFMPSPLKGYCGSIVVWTR